MRRGATKSGRALVVVEAVSSDPDRSALKRNEFRGEGEALPVSVETAAPVFGPTNAWHLAIYIGGVLAKNNRLDSGFRRND